jgi:hypothetical protein
MERVVSNRTRAILGLKERRDQGEEGRDVPGNYAWRRQGQLMLLVLPYRELGVEENKEERAHRSRSSLFLPSICFALDTMVGLAGL